MTMFDDRFAAMVLVVVLGAAALILRIVISRRARQEHSIDKSSFSQQGFDGVVPGQVLVVFASQSGFAESLAWRTALALRSGGIPARQIQFGQLDGRELQMCSEALFIVSTTGNGEPPDNAYPFAQRGMKNRLDLSGLKYAVLALGDRSHDNFCAFGCRLDRWLQRCGAQALRELITVDNADEYAIRQWHDFLHKLAPQGETCFSQPQYTRWRLVDRTLMNPGSEADGIYHLVLHAVDPAPAWEAGDIAVVFPGPVRFAFSDADNRKPREYSVASVPADGALELVVRQTFLPDGRLGVGSEWLTSEVQPGDHIALVLRNNSAFHDQSVEAPMILIGSGTGIAGLRAHLRARQLRGNHRNWLIFGERSAERDWLFRDEIEGWHNDGHIERLDLAFSRDQREVLYVQHRMEASAHDIRQWVDEGGTIYVCGRLDGMGADVHTALVGILGEDSINRLRDEHRYCRDVY